MNKLAQLVLGCLLTVLVPTLAMAQMEELKNSTPKERADMQTQWMKDNLALDDKVAATIAAINLKYARENQALMDSSEPRFQKLIALKKNSQAKDAEMKSVLSAGQYSQYEEKKQALRAELKQKMQDRQQAAQ